MAVLVDYACPTCGTRVEAWVPSPPATARVCPSCGGDARRVWSPVGLLRGSTSGNIGHPPGAASPAAATSAAGETRPLCLDNPDVPGLCHMTPSAGRAWLARARGDNRALDGELAHQEEAAKTSPPTLDSVVSHHHHHDGGGAHGHGDGSPHRTPADTPASSP